MLVRQGFEAGLLLRFDFIGFIHSYIIYYPVGNPMAFLKINKNNFSGRSPSDGRAQPAVCGP